MKRTALRLTLAAAAVLAAVTTGSAQTMKAEIPFPFQAAGTRMLPGAYSVKVTRLTGGTTIVWISDWDSNRSVMAIPQYTSEPAQPRSGQVTLSFACTNGNCVLSSLHDDMSADYNFSPGKKSPETRIATVVLRTDRAE